MAQERLTKDQRREQAREIARLEREQRQKAQRRNGILIRVGATLGIVGLLAAVGWGIWAGTRPAGPGPANMASDGILLTGADGEVTVVETAGLAADASPIATDPSEYDVPIHIVTYIDFGCPFCQAFEIANAEQIREMVAQGFATLEVHPINLLSNQFQGTRYSARSANAAACVAAYEPEAFLDVSAAFFAQQPAEDSAGLDNGQIVTLLEGAGVTSDEVTECVNSEAFRGWVDAATARAFAGPLPNTTETQVTGTPTILVNGVKYAPADLSDPQEFAAFAALNADFDETDPTPTPTPTP